MSKYSYFHNYGNNPMKTITVTVAPHSNPKAHLLIPTGFDDGFDQPIQLDATNVERHEALCSDFGEQTAWECTVENPAASTSVVYQFTPSDRPLTDTVWQGQANRYTQASADLLTDIHASIDQTLPVRQQIRQLIEKAQSHFDYGHGDGRFYDGNETVPSLCGTTRGSCVDINTYLLAAAHALDIPVQYLAGYWFHPDKTQTLDMHCWMIFKADDEVIPWDLAHHMKWGVDELAEGLNPAGGRRVAMSFGRGLSFKTQYGPVTISHFSEPVWILPDRTTETSKLTISIEEVTAE
jgi:hypothetical protein